ncbi:hypothetical protein [Mycolicibacterium sp. P1-5]|uniref:hypothetical protein n=1 Tax=Mycolicibacterium sp. P1-5 TaxID=2024617 RepID=UPI0011ED619D|nr:hypothetical protein [Mycolicibacterium sp. P1-5]KAA0108316.1 hypothetical protein CIW47_14555 [Mycolicibacterium sp. P1-5]
MAGIKTALSVAALAVGLTMGAAPLASADPPPPDQNVGEPAPDWAPRKPAEVWAGHPVVWTHMWGGRWGVWINDQFITLSSNPVTNGG